MFLQSLSWYAHDVDDFSISNNNIVPRGLHRPKSGTDAMATCEEQSNFFQRTMEELLMDTHFPYKSVTRHTADKPWVTDYFRHLIRQRQRALMSGELDEPRRLRNLVNRTAPKLRQRFYQSKIAALKETSSNDWWKHEESDGRSIQHVTLTRCRDSLTSARRAIWPNLLMRVPW